MSNQQLTSDPLASTEHLLELILGCFGRLEERVRMAVRVELTSGIRGSLDVITLCLVHLGDVLDGPGPVGLDFQDLRFRNRGRARLGVRHGGMVQEDANLILSNYQYDPLKNFHNQYDDYETIRNDTNLSNMHIKTTQSQDRHTNISTYQHVIYPNFRNLAKLVTESANI